MTDWNDRIVDEHTRRVEEMRKTASFHMKHELYKRPEFKFYHSLGIFNFGIDFCECWKKIAWV